MQSRKRTVPTMVDSSGAARPLATVERDSDATQRVARMPIASSAPATGESAAPVTIAKPVPNARFMIVVP